MTVPEEWKDAPEVPGFTIDGPDSKDLDDAIWVEKTDEGFLVTVSITAVSTQVTPKSDRDERALDRVETSYGKTKNYPMLPRWLADDKASLLAGTQRPVVVTKIALDKTLKVTSSELSTGFLTSKAKLCHADIPEIQKNPEHELNSQIQLCVHVAQGLVERRRSAGAFVFYDLNHGWITTEEGHVRKLKDTRETIGHIVVQELMILANAATAELCAREEIAVPFRNHTAKAHAPDRQEIVERLAAGMNEPLRGLDTLRKQVNLIMNRADYGAELKGHYGLNLAAYLHCTSPIRRYADLLTQRQLIAYIRRNRGEETEFPHDRDEVTHLAKVITTTLRVKLEEESAYQQKKASERAEGSIAGDVDLSKLKDKEFERVAKVIVRAGDFVPEFAEAIHKRIEAGTITVMDLFLVLLDTPNDDKEWEEFRGSILRGYLFEYPHVVPSIASMALSLQGWSEATYTEADYGPPHARSFVVQAQARVQGPEGKHYQEKGPPAGALSLKVAKQRALVYLLCKVRKCGDPPEWEDTGPEKFPEKSAPGTPVPETGDNPIAALQEFAQSTGSVMPTYGAERVGGKDHTPTFKARCSFRGLTVETEAMPNKKLAKKIAAAAMIEKLGKLGKMLS